MDNSIPENPSFSWFLKHMPVGGWISYLVSLLTAVTFGVSLAHIQAVREFAQIKIEPEIKIKEVIVPSKHNPEIDKKIQEWISSNESRIGKLHEQLRKAEEEARYWAGYYEKVKVFEASANRLQKSIALEQESFSSNLGVLKELIQNQ